MQTDTYLTIRNQGESLYKEKGSKFIGLAYPVTDEEAVKEVLQELRKSYHDARHHCYAWVLTPAGDRVRANDDGEPNHSAGDPILGQIKSLNLTNTLVVVIRYFGGTKLGVSGLIHAYKTAAAAALANCTIVEETVRISLSLTYSYEQTSIVMRTISSFDANIAEQDFTENCSLTLEVKAGEYKRLEEELTEIEGVSVLV